MKQSKQCPKCDSVNLGVFPEVGLLLNEKSGRSSCFGGFEVICCGECGYAEFYVTPLPQERIAKGMKPMEERDCKFHWRYPPAPSEGPYR